MKLSLLLLSTVFLALNALADCASSGIEVFPKTQSIPKNSLIILEGYYIDQETVRSIGFGYTAQLISKKHVVTLKKIQTFEGMMHLTKVVLQPESELIPGEVYTLKITKKEDKSERTPTRYDEILNKYVEVSWKVQSTLDETKPKWKNLPGHKENSWVGYGCGPAIYAMFSAQAEDASETYVIVELQNKQLTKTNQYLLQLTAGTINIGHGMCSGGFTFSTEEKAEYQARFKLFDVCGNHSDEWTDWISFDNPNGAMKY